MDPSAACRHSRHCVSPEMDVFLPKHCCKVEACHKERLLGNGKYIVEIWEISDTSSFQRDGTRGISLPVSSHYSNGGCQENLWLANCLIGLSSKCVMTSSSKDASVTEEKENVSTFSNRIKPHWFFLISSSLGALGPSSWGPRWCLIKRSPLRTRLKSKPMVVTNKLLYFPSISPFVPIILNERFPIITICIWLMVIRQGCDERRSTLSERPTLPSLINTDNNANRSSFVCCLLLIQFYQSAF